MAGLEPPTRLDLAEANVSTVIWSTGFTADFSWLPAAVRDPDGLSVHDRGVAPIPGMYFLGFPWLRRRKSGIILGIDDDARFVAGAIGEHLNS